MFRIFFKRLWHSVALCAVLLIVAGCAENQNLAEGLGYDLLPVPDQQYPDAEGKSLTDGIFASADDMSQGWVGFNRDEPTITLDLEAVCNIDSVTVSCLSRPEFGVEPPKSVELLVSQDGQRWIFSGTLNPSEKGPTKFRVETPGLRARYVRLALGRVNDSWMLVDEVQVLGSIAGSGSPPVLTGNLALGLPYRFDIPPGKDYPDVDGISLTDGKFADAEDLQSGWVGFDDEQNAVTFDLQTVCKIDRIEASFLSYAEYGVSLPNSVELMVSQDGRRWVSNGMLTPSQDDPSLFVRKTSDLRVRYMRLTISGDNWTFLDEIQIFGSIAPALNPIVPVVSGNLAAGLAFVVQPQPSEDYSNTLVLTDGKRASPDNLHEGWVGFDSGQPTITLDLESICKITRIRASFLSQAESGVNLPQAVRLMFSLDGERWFFGGILSATEAGPEEFGFELDGLRARYLKIQIDRSQWVLIDEIEVIGSITPSFYTYLPMLKKDMWAASPAGVGPLREEWVYYPVSY